MKRLFYLLSIVFILTACNSNQTNEKNENKEETKSSNKNKENKKENKDNFKIYDIGSKEFYNLYLKEKGKGFNGIEPGMSFEKVKNKIGSYHSSGEGIGGHTFYFDQYEIIFANVESEEELKDSSIVKYIFIHSKNYTDFSKFLNIWGNDYKQTYLDNDGGNSIFMFEKNGQKVYAYKNGGMILSVSKQNVDNLFDENSKDGIDNKNTDDSITKVNGVAHYNFPNIDTAEFGDLILSNKFNILGYKPGDGQSVGDLIEDLGDSKHMTGDNVVYDNFTLGVGSNGLASYRLDVSDQNVSLQKLVQSWRQKYIKTSDSNIIYDGDIENGYYVVIEVNNSGVVQQIDIIGSNRDEDTSNDVIIDPFDDENSNSGINFKDANLSIKNGYAHYNFPSLRNKAFVEKLLSNNFTFEGVGVNKGDNINIAEVLGNSRDEAAGFSQFDNFTIITADKMKIEGFDIYISENITLDELEKLWGYEVAKRDTDYLIYDTRKNDFHAIVRSNEEGFVTSVSIWKGDYNPQ